MSPRSSRLRNVHRLSAAAAGLGGVFACSSEPSGSPEANTTRSLSEAQTASCQALDIAVKKDGDDGSGGTTYAINTGGQVFGWGSNQAPFYPLGSSGASSRQTAPLSLGVSNAVALAAGRYGACAIVNGAPTAQGAVNGRVSCWGWQPGLADPRITPMQPGQETPTLVESDETGLPLSGVTAIAYGDNHVCALMSDKTVFCAGDNSFGQLGDGTSTTVRTAVHMVDRLGVVVSGVTQIAAAGNSTCILRMVTSGAADSGADAGQGTVVGEVDCLGDNTVGQLGQGSVGSSVEPVPSPIALPPGTSLSFTSLYGGGDGTFCATTALDSGAQTTYCWGENDYGQVRIKDHSVAPGLWKISTDVGSRWAQGDRDACEINGAGNVSCWGSNTYGQIAGAGGIEVNKATAISGLANALKVSVGQSHVCALMADSLACWGRNKSGEIGNGLSADVATPITKVFLSTPDLPACGTGQVGEACGAFSNLCGSRDCGACSPLSSCDATTRTCKDDPTKCSPSCGAGMSCVQHACLPYCVAQAPDTKIALTGASFSLTSSSTYGMNACGGYDLEVTNADAFPNELLIVGPATRPTTPAACTSLRIDLSYFANGAQLGSATTQYGSWYTGGSTPYCTFGNLSSVGIWTMMPPAGDLRIVADVQQSVSVGKSGTAWQNVPLKIYLVDQCKDGSQDGGEAGVDCGGPYCQACSKKCGGNTHDCGDGKCVSTPCP